MPKSPQLASYDVAVLLQAPPRSPYSVPEDDPCQAKRFQSLPKACDDIWGLYMKSSIKKKYTLSLSIFFTMAALENSHMTQSTCCWSLAPSNTQLWTTPQDILPWWNMPILTHCRQFTFGSRTTTVSSDFIPATIICSKQPLCMLRATIWQRLDYHLQNIGIQT